jgi:hypothetical protein
MERTNENQPQMASARSLGQKIKMLKIQKLQKK